METPSPTEPFPRLEGSPPLRPIFPETISPGDEPLSPLASEMATRQSPSPSFSDTLRRMSRTFEESDLPGGFCAATGSFASSMANLSRTTSYDAVNSDTRSPVAGHRGSLSLSKPDSSSGDARRQTSTSLIDTSLRQVSTAPELRGSTDTGGGERAVKFEPQEPSISRETAATDADSDSKPRRTDTAAFDNGYHFPPSHGFGKSLRLGAISFWRYFLTPIGFAVVVYGLLVVGWGGMLFLLLCNAAPAMCYPDCNDIDSPRRKWIEIDSQIINALFCVTGFGLAPWRFRDLWFLMKYRVRRESIGLRRLAGIHRGWFRLAGSQELPADLGPGNIGSFPHEQDDTRIPYPETAIPDAPLTGQRAPPTKVWTLDFAIWCNVGNTIMQCLLSGFMWGMTRKNRPGFAVGLFVGLGMLLAAAGGLVMFFEGKKVKGVEGVPVSDEDIAKLARDRERGISHYNNIKDKKPKAEDEKKWRLRLRMPRGDTVS